MPRWPVKQEPKKRGRKSNLDKSTKAAETNPDISSSFEKQPSCYEKNPEKQPDYESIVTELSFMQAELDLLKVHYNTLKGGIHELNDRIIKLENENKIEEMLTPKPKHGWFRSLF